MTNANKTPTPARAWPFPPATGPTPWTPGQLREYKREQAQPPKNAPPALW